MIIFFSEGQRKANFEEYDARKRENAQKIFDLKKKVKELYVKYARAKNVGSQKKRKQSISFYKLIYTNILNLLE